MNPQEAESSIATGDQLEGALPQLESSSVAINSPAEFSPAGLQHTFGNALLAASASGGTAPDSTQTPTLHHTFGNAAVARTLVQRKAADGPATAAATPPTGEPQGTDAAAGAVSSRTLIVEDTAETVQPEQMKKTEFLTQLRSALRNTAAGTSFAAIAGPALDTAFAQYGSQSSAQLERTIHARVPEATAAASATVLIQTIVSRASRALADQAPTGAGGILAAAGSAVSSVSSAISAAASGVVAGVGSAISGLGSIFFKERNERSQQRNDDPAAIQSQLGGGHSLESGVKSRMESAYGQSFSGVEIHSDTKAARLSNNLNARAFTVGQNVAFGAGEYQPGTLIGDALIAHELAHVVQQRGGAVTEGAAQKGENAHEALEQDADEAAVGAVVSAWSGAKKGLTKISERAMPTLKSGLRLQRCQGNVAIPSEYYRAPTIRPEDEQLLQQLEGRHAVYASFRAYADALKSDANLSGMGMAAGMYGAPVGMGIGMSLGNVGHLNDLRRQLENDLREEGFSSIEDFEQKIRQFKQFFRRYALQAAFQILRENEQLVQGESGRYNGGDALGALRTALQPVRAKYEAASRIPLVARRERDDMTTAVMYLPAPEAEALEDEAEHMARGLAVRFPILADPAISIKRLVYADDETLKSTLRDTAGDRLSDIRETRQNLGNDPELVWQMEVAVARARGMLGVVQGSIYDAIIQDKLSEISVDHMFRSLLIGALAIGLGVVSAGTGTVAVLAAAGLAGLSLGVAAAHTQEYLIQQAAAGTSFDRARALTAHEPSLGWLALDIAAAVLDLGAAAAAFRGLSATARAVAEGTASINDLRRQALTIGEDLASTNKIADAQAFANGVVAAAERAQQGRRLLAASPEAANAIRMAAPGLDEIAVTGILRLSPEVRAVALTKFAGNAEVLGRLGAMAEQSEHVVNAVNLLRRNLSETQFNAVLGHYLKARDLDSVAQLLRAIGEAGVSDDAIRGIAASMGRVRTEGGIIRKFTPQIHAAIADELGPGAQGIQRLLQITEGLHPNQSGTIFESWATRYVYGGSRERAAIDTSTLTGPYSRNPMTSDNWLPSGGGSIVVDFKHLRSGETFSGSAATQLRDYASLLRDGATFKGRPITQVEYLFSTLEAAQNNAANIRRALVGNVTIKYIDPLTGAPAILP